MDTLRTFIAIELPANVRAKIAEHINRLRRECSDVRASWSREDNLHLTLKFLGNVSLERIPALSTAVDEAAQHMHPFDLIVKGCGAFPPHDRPKVLWIGVDFGTADIRTEVSTGSGPASSRGQPAWGGGSDRVAAPTGEVPAASSQSPTPNPLPPLASLHAALEDRCAAAGFERDARAFHPHLTIARLRKPAGSRRLAEAHKSLGFSFEGFSVSEIVVFKSELGREGSKHTVLSRHQLVSKAK